MNLVPVLDDRQVLRPAANTAGCGGELLSVTTSQYIVVKYYDLPPENQPANHGIPP